MSLTLPALQLPEGAIEDSADEARAERVDLRQAVLAHHDFVWRSVRRLGVREADAGDATQRVFLVLAKRIDEVTPNKLRAFLFGIAMRIAANERRAQRNRTPHAAPEQAERLVCPAPSAEDQVDRARARAMLDEMLDALEDDLRSVFVLYELEHLTVPEIAECLHIPPGTVASRLRRARAAVHAHVQRLRARMNRGTP